MTSDMCGKKEFGVKDDTKVTDVGARWDSRVLKVDWGRVGIYTGVNYL